MLPHPRALPAGALRPAAARPRHGDGAVRQIQESGGRLGMRELSIALGVSQKHLIDLFTRLVGLRPKQFARVVRLSALLPALEGESSPDWAQLAQLAGYHDQAHFNREFRLFAGLSPRKYISLRKSYFEHYPGGTWTHASCPSVNFLQYSSASPVYNGLIFRLYWRSACGR